MKVLINAFFVFSLFQFHFVSFSSTSDATSNLNKIESNLVISSILNLNGNFKFSVYDPALKRRFWISSGRTYNGYTFLKYDTDNSTVYLSKEGKNFQVPIIKSNERPVQITINKPSQNVALENTLPSTAEIQAFKQQEYSKLPNKDAVNYKLLRTSADNRIQTFSLTPIENTYLEKQINDDLSDRTEKSFSLGGRTQKTKVKTTIHSSVYLESQIETGN